MALDTERLGKETASQGAASGVSHLAGIRGHGTLQVVRGRRNDVMEVIGTWRPEDEDADLAALTRAAQDEEPVRFDGVFADPQAPDRSSAVTQCLITSSGTYTFDATLPEDETGPVLRVFNFRPVDDADVIGGD